MTTQRIILDTRYESKSQKTIILGIMIVYSVTLNVEDDIREEWLEWMQTVHIPEVLQTGLFAGHKMFKLLTKMEGEGGTTYNIQYYLDSMANYEQYVMKYAPRLQQETASRYGSKMLAFRTLLEQIGGE